MPLKLYLTHWWGERYGYITVSNLEIKSPCGTVFALTINQKGSSLFILMDLILIICTWFEKT